MNILFQDSIKQLNPYLAQTGSENNATLPVLEPLARYGPDFEPGRTLLAAEIPTLANGGVSKDLTTITWKLRPEVKWSDGTAFTAADVVFTWRFIVDAYKGTSAESFTTNVKAVEALDPLTVRTTFIAADPSPHRLFVSNPILQEQQFKDYLGPNVKKARELRPIGTGPYRIKELRDDLVTYDINALYRESDKPFFKEVVVKGAVDPATAARALFETGEADVAQIADGIDGDLLRTLTTATSSKGRFLTNGTSSVERLSLNRSDPDPALGDMRSEPGRPHPFLADLRVRQALAMAVDRRRIADQYTGGAAAEPICNIFQHPAIPEWTSTNTLAEPVCRFDLAAAARLLDDAGWTRGPDGVRQKNGVRLKVLLATTINTTRQGTQAILKEAWAKIGVETESKAVPTARFFGEGADAAARFFADLQIYTSDPGSSDRSALDYLKSWTTSEIKARAANWSGTNYERWSNAQYDALWGQADRETDQARRRSLFVQMNDLLIRDVVVVPLLYRKQMRGVAKSLKGYVHEQGRYFDIANWSR